MAKNVQITGVTINEAFATVQYETGSIKNYKLDKLPKTVQKWLENNEPHTIKVEVVLESPQSENPRLEEHYNFISFSPKAVIKMIFFGMGSFILNFLTSLCYFANDVIEGSLFISELINCGLSRVTKTLSRLIRKTADSAEVTADRIHHVAVTLRLTAVAIIVLVTPIIRDWWNTSYDFRKSVLSECRENIWFNNN